MGIADGVPVERRGKVTQRCRFLRRESVLPDQDEAGEAGVEEGEDAGAVCWGC